MGLRIWATPADTKPAVYSVPHTTLPAAGPATAAAAKSTAAKSGAAAGPAIIPGFEIGNSPPPAAGRASSKATQRAGEPEKFDNASNNFVPCALIRTCLKT